MTDVEILAKHTTQITAREEYGARTSGADKYVFFAKMRAYRADYGRIRDAAEAEFAAKTACPALPGTEYAGIGKLP